MKYSFAFFALFLLTLSACAPSQSVQEEEMTPQPEQGMEEETQPDTPQDMMPGEGYMGGEDETDSLYMEPATEQPVPPKRTIEISADNWSFSPAAITAKKGEVVEVHLIGVGGVHGFAAPGLGINVPVNAGESVTVDIPTAEVGTFEFFCSIPCGSGHRDMRGTITIEE